jgi:hypothetical protein
MARTGTRVADHVRSLERRVSPIDPHGVTLLVAMTM